MSIRTNKYQLTAFQEGDFTSAIPEMQRWETIDAQLYALFSIMGNGIISGWDLASYSGLSISVSPGSGHVAFVAVESTEQAIVSLTSNCSNYIYAVLDRTSYWTKSVNFSSFVSPSIDPDMLYLGKVTTDYNVVTEIDITGRTELGFIALIQSLVKAHRHIGGTDNPSPIDLSSEVQGIISIDNLPDLDASVIKTGTIDSDRLPIIDHTTKLTGVGSLTHAQLDTLVEQLSIADQKLMGEVSTVNLLQLILALKHAYPDIDEFLVNEIAFIPGISPNDYIDADNTTAIVDTRTYMEGGQHTITGIPSAGTKAYTKVWDTQDDFDDSTNNNVYITGDTVAISVKEEQSVIEEFSTLTGWSLETQDNSSIPSNITLDSTTYVVPPNSGKLSIEAETVEVKLLVKKIFDAQDWSSYRFIKFYLKTDSVQHGDLFFYFKDSYYGAQNSYVKVLNRNTPTINIDTLLNGWQEITVDLSEYNRDNINEIGFYVTTKDGWDTSKGFDLNIDNVIVTSGSMYEEDGYIRLIYGNDFPYTFWKIRWDAIVPTDSEATGVALQARCRVANTIPELSSAIWFPYTSTSGDVIPVTETYKYIEVEFYFTASTTQTRSITLKKAYLDFYVSDVDNSFEYTSKEDWDAGTLFNIDTETYPGSMVISNTGDINSYYYGTDGKAYQLDSNLSDLYEVIGNALPKTTYQALNGLSPSLGLITGIARGNNGNMWMSDIDNDRIIEVDKAGNLVRAFYGSFLTPPIDTYGEEEAGPGSNVTISSNVSSTTTSSVVIPGLSVLHSIYNQYDGVLYIVFNKDLENIYQSSNTLNLSRIYIKLGTQKIYLNGSTIELLGVDETKYNLWHGVGTSTFTEFLNQFSFNSHVLKITVIGADRTLLDYLLNQENPSVIVASPTESQKVTSSVTLNFLTNYVDLSTDKLRVTLDNTNIQTITQRTISYSGLSNGKHTVKIEVLDSNSAVYSNIEATANTHFIVENSYSLPIVYFNSPRSNQIFSSSPVQIDFKVDNFPIVPSGQHIKYVIDTEVAEDYYSTDPIVIEDLEPGKHTITIYLVDDSGTTLSYTYGSSTLEFIVGTNSLAIPKLYIETSAIKDSTGTYTTTTQRLYIDTGNVVFSNIYSPIDLQVIPEDDSQNGVTVLVSKLRSPSWTEGLSGQENATELIARVNNSITGSTPITLNALLSSVKDKELIYGTKYLNGHSVIQLDMDGNVVFSNNAAIFADSKDNAKDLLGSAEKIGIDELMIGDSIRKRAIIVNTNLTTQIPTVAWQYDCDRYVPDFHLVPQEEIVISVNDGSISEEELFIRSNTTVIWENNSSVPISIYSGYTTYDLFQAEPDLAFYGSAFKSSTLQPGERYSFKFSSVANYDWFVYPSILTAKINVTNQRISDRDSYWLLESDGLDNPFSSRAVKIDSWGNVVKSFGESYLVKPRDIRCLLNGGLLIST